MKSISWLIIVFGLGFIVERLGLFQKYDEGFVIGAVIIGGTILWFIYKIFVEQKIYDKLFNKKKSE